MNFNFCETTNAFAQDLCFVFQWKLKHWLFKILIVSRETRHYLEAIASLQKTICIGSIDQSSWWTDSAWEFQDLTNYCLATNHDTPTNTCQWISEFLIIRNIFPNFRVSYSELSWWFGKVSQIDNLWMQWLIGSILRTVYWQVFISWSLWSSSSTLTSYDPVSSFKKQVEETKPGSDKTNWLQQQQRHLPDFPRTLHSNLRHQQLGDNAEKEES